MAADFACALNDGLRQVAEQYNRQLTALETLSAKRLSGGGWAADVTAYDSVSMSTMMLRMTMRPDGSNGFTLSGVNRINWGAPEEQISTQSLSDESAKVARAIVGVERGEAVEAQAYRARAVAKDDNRTAFETPSGLSEYTGLNEDWRELVRRAEGGAERQGGKLQGLDMRSFVSDVDYMFRL